MKKGGDFFVVVGIVVSFFMFVYLYSGGIDRIGFSPIVDACAEINGNCVIISDCSDAEIRNQWDDIFDTASPTAGIYFSDDSGVYGCDNYAAWKENNGLFYVLAGSFENNPDDDSLVLIALAGNLTSNVRGNISDPGNTDRVTYLTGIIDDLERNAGSRAVSSNSDALASFNSVFSVENSSSFLFDSASKIYEFTYEESEEQEVLTIDLTESGGVHSTNESAFFYISQYRGPPACNQNWTAVSGNCTSSDVKNVWYNDTNMCGNITGRPANQSVDCDYNGLGIIGDEGDFEDDGVDLELFIDGDELELDEKYEDELDVEFIDDDGNVRVAFEHDFDDGPLNLREIEIEIEDDGNHGWIIVNGLEDEEKTVWVKKKSNSSQHVCIEDDEVNSINSVSFRCDRSDEHLVSCPGSRGGFDCVISGGFLRVDGLDNSAVREVLPNMLNGSTNPGNCVSNWDCGGWSACVGGTKTRTCTDLNNCGTISGRPNVQDTCVVVTPTCSPDWDCTEWVPSGECPSEGFKTRTCSDSNSCNTSSGKPAEKFDCEEPESHTFAIVMIVVLSILIIATVVVLVILVKKREQARRREIQRSNVQLIQGQPRF